MNRRDQIGSVVWGGAGLLIIVGSLSSLKVGSVHDPGPGLFPLMAGILLAGFSGAVFLKAAFQKGVEKGHLGQLWVGLDGPKVAYTIAALLAYTLLLETVGFLLVTLLLFIFLFRRIEPQSWQRVIVLSVLASVGAYLIFDRALQVQLPRGLLGF
jgi:putative tricarboxylic transport membrane protein